MSNILYQPISKKYIKNMQILFFFSFLLSLVKSQNQKYTEESMKAEIIGGLGVGTLCVIIFMAVGVVLCIFGLATTNPALWVFLGILLPFLVFLFVAFCPRQTESHKESTENSKRNNYIIARWMHFLVMLLLFLGLLGPAFIKWNMTLIPQRVDSSSQKDLYDEKYLEAIEKQKKRKYYLDENDELLPQKLPLGNNRRNNNFVRNNQSDSLIQSSQNISNNLIDNNLDNSNNNEFPRPILPSTTKRNEFNENRRKFGGFIRKKDK